MIAWFIAFSITLTILELISWIPAVARDAARDAAWAGQIKLLVDMLEGQEADT